MKAEKEVRGGRPDLATIYLDKVVIYAIVTIITIITITTTTITRPIYAIVTACM